MNKLYVDQDAGACADQRRAGPTRGVSLLHCKDAHQPLLRAGLTDGRDALCSPPPPSQSWAVRHTPSSTPAHLLAGLSRAADRRLPLCGLCCRLKSPPQQVLARLSLSLPDLYEASHLSSGRSHISRPITVTYTVWSTASQTAGSTSGTYVFV